MKYFVLFLLVVMATFTSQAQITIVDSDLAPAGTTIYIAFDSVVENQLTPGAPGGNKMWDFGILTAHTTDTVMLMLPSDTPYGDDFPFSNFAVGIESADQYAYFSRNSNLLSNIGVAAYTDEYGFVTTEIVPANIYLDYPVTYGNTRQETYSLEIRLADNSLPGVDSIKYRSTTSEYLSVDAWGTMVLPIGTFDVLRQKEEKTVSDSIWTKFFGNWILLSSGVDEVDTYNWWTNDVGAGFTLCSFDVDRPSQEVTNVSFLNSYTVGIDQKHVERLFCSPNPAINQLKVGFPDGLTPDQIQVRGMNGQSVEVDADWNVNFVNLEISALPHGIYFVTLYFVDHSPITAKVTKQN